MNEEIEGLEPLAADIRLDDERFAALCRQATRSLAERTDGAAFQPLVTLLVHLGARQTKFAQRLLEMELELRTLRKDISEGG